MTGKIGNDRLPSNVSPAKNGTFDRRMAGQEKSKIKSTGTEKVDISVRKAEVEKLKKLATELADSRRDKIAFLQEQVNRGTYHVDSVAVAEKMLGNR